MRTRILKGADRLIFWLSVLLLAFLTLVSLISTTYFEPERFWAEQPLYRTDIVILNLACLAIGFGLIFFLYRRGILKSIPTRTLLAAAVLFVIVLSALWVSVSHTYPQADQEAISRVAWLMIEDNYRFFRPGKYMQFYPNQLGMVAVLEAVYRVTGGENWQVYMYLTAFMNGALVWFLYRITDRLFGKKEIDNLVLFLSMGCLQVILYTTFIYGIIPGLVLTLASFYCLLIFLEGGKFRYALLGAVLIGAGCLIKNNYSIFLVAMVLLLLYMAVKEKRFKIAAAAVVLVIATAGMDSGLDLIYEQRTGYEISSGMPRSLWIAMGMQEGTRAEGWYNEFNFNTFEETGGDAGESDRIARESIAESLETFINDPAYMLRFYYNKTVSQWNEPTYEAFWVNRSHIGEYSAIVQSIYDGKLYTALFEYMNIYQSLIFAAAFAVLLIRRRHWTFEQLFLFLSVLGGFAFHTLWEAKSQYILPYFICLLPYAAAGLYFFGEWLEHRETLRAEKGGAK